MNMVKMLEFDRRVSARLRLEPENRVLWAINAFLAHSGDSWFWLAALFIIWLFGSPAWRVRAALLAAGILSLAVLVLAIKFKVRRQRPVGEWGAIYRVTDPHSFPSGHAARACLLAVLACGLGPAWFAVVVIFWMPFVSLARVAMGLHYFSDVVAGLTMGLVVGLFFLAAQPLLMAWFPFVF